MCLIVWLDHTGKPLTSAFATPSVSIDESWFDNKPSQEPKPQIFADKIYVVEFISRVSFKEKSQLKEKIKSHGGTISHILNKKVGSYINFPVLVG